MNIKAYILHAWKMAGTDVHFKVSYPVFYRDKHGELEVISKEKLTYAELHDFIVENLAENILEELDNKNEVDIGLSLYPSEQIKVMPVRLRINIFSDSKTLSMAVRILRQNIPHMQELGIPAPIQALCDTAENGLILFC